MSIDPHPHPRYRVARRATAWVLYAAIALTTTFVLAHLARGTLARWARTKVVVRAMAAYSTQAVARRATR